MLADLRNVSYKYCSQSKICDLGCDRSERCDLVVIDLRSVT